MTFEAEARQRVKASLDALANQISQVARKECDALRAALDARIGALDDALSHADAAEALEDLVRDVSKAATEQAEEAASRARLEAQEVAQTELAAIRVEFESRLDREKTVNAELTSWWAVAQREAAAARNEVETLTARLNEVRAHVKTREEEGTQTRRALDEATAHLDREVRSRVGLGEALEAARREATTARAEANTRRWELDAAVERIRTLEEARLTPKGAVQHREPAEVRRTGPGAEAHHAQHSTTRHARRVKIQEGIEVLVDGSVSVLVDLSPLGAQVLSPNVVRPNRSVRLSLPIEEGALSCKARVVWAAFEQSRGGGPVWYRAGVKFTDVDATVVETFAIEHGIADDVKKAAAE